MRHAREIGGGPAAVLFAAALVLLDLVTKVAGRFLLPGEGLDLLPGLILRVSTNTRGPFGLGPLWLSAGISVVVLLGLAARLARHGPSSLDRVAGGLLVGGGLANLGERFLSGGTTDLLIVGNLTTLNLADIAILTGLVLLVVGVPSVRKSPEEYP